MCLVEFALQNIVNNRTEIFCRGHGIREFRPGIQILKIEASDNFALHTFIEINQIADHAVFIHLPADRDLEDVVVSVAVRIIALAVNGAVLRVGHLLAVQAMRSRETVAAMEVSFHTCKPLPAREDLDPVSSRLAEQAREGPYENRQSHLASIRLAVLLATQFIRADVRSLSRRLWRRVRDDNIFKLFTSQITQFSQGPK
jgi:hypothetical protein